jgi:hypothetical protein
MPGGDAGRRAGGPGEVAHRDRSPGDESDPLLLARLQNVIGCLLAQAEAVLDRGDVDQPARPTHLGQRYLRDADEADLSLVAKVRDGPELFLERYHRIDPVQLPEVDGVEPKPAQAALAVGSQAVGPPVGMAAAAEPALGR